jgi:hypothetical protein
MATKRIVINGSAIWRGGLPALTLNAASNTLQNAVMNHGGWRIINWNFLNTSNSWTCPCPFVINVEAEVSAGFSDSAHRDYLATMLKGFRYDGLLNTVENLIYDVRLTAQSSDINTGKPIGNPVYTGLTEEQIRQIQQRAQTPPSNSDSDDNNTPEILGVSTGVLIGAAVLAVILFRR